MSRSPQYLDCPMCGHAAIPQMPESLRDETWPDGPCFELHSEHECKHCGAQLRVDDNEDCVGVEVYDDDTMTWRSALEVT